MNNIENAKTQSEKESIKSKSITKQKTVLVLCITIFGAIAGFTSGHLNSVYGILLFALSIIAIGIILYFYYRKK